MADSHIRFTAMPGGPDDPPCEFVELEDEDGHGLGVGEWIQDGEYAVLLIPRPAATDDRAGEVERIARAVIQAHQALHDETLCECRLCSAVRALDARKP